MLRCNKQGINQSIANHLELLTAKWPKKEQLSNFAIEMYNRREEVCKIWANQCKEHASSNGVHDTYNSSSLTS